MEDDCYDNDDDYETTNGGTINGRTCTCRRQRTSMTHFKNNQCCCHAWIFIVGRRVLIECFHVFGIAKRIAALFGRMERLLVLLFWILWSFPGASRHSQISTTRIVAQS
jgi:hypothetical protein